MTQKNTNRIKLLDCTLRDGGYYNSWDFDNQLIQDYLFAMDAVGVDYVEIGFRFLENIDFKGGCAFSTDQFINSFHLPKNLEIGVMLNAGDFLKSIDDLDENLSLVFPASAEASPVNLVRIACHFHEFELALPMANWLNARGYKVGFNIMQISAKSEQEITALALKASAFPIDVLYFADSLGNLSPTSTRSIVRWLKNGWKGEIGIHTHDNMGKAMANTLSAIEEGVTWVDGTVSGMGRGPGNAKTEFLVLALDEMRSIDPNVIPLFQTIRNHFKPLMELYGWGANPYYYLAGKHGIHPSYIQKMLDDNRYDEEDILAVIEHLKEVDAKSFRLETLESARHFYNGPQRGSWNPVNLIEGKSVLILGTGPGLVTHHDAIVNFINEFEPFVIALNARESLPNELIHVRAACHPLRLLADTAEHIQQSQPLITPKTMLPEEVQQALKGKKMFDFGLCVETDCFSFEANSATIPGLFVTAYALAIATSGKAKNIFLAGFDGYEPGDPRQQESQYIFDVYANTENALEITAITPSSYNIHARSVYGILDV